MSKPLLLDAFCGGGGCTKGYQHAGFEVVGIDINARSSYCGDDFILGDALEVLDRLLRGEGVEAQSGRVYYLSDFAAIHASPPCQAFTSLRHLGKRAGEGAPDLVDATRQRLQDAGVPWVIENVMGSPLRNAVVLCGSSFGLGVRRHRLFECSLPVLVPSCLHGISARPIAVYGDHPGDSRRENINRARTLDEGQRAMGIDWMTWRSLTQAIPPAYTEHIGYFLMAELSARAAA